jgi:hypothetical protein
VGTADIRHCQSTVRHHRRISGYALRIWLYITVEARVRKIKRDEPTSTQPRRRGTALGELTHGVLWDLDDQHVALGPVHHLSRDGTELVTLYGAESAVPDHDKTPRV